jgi:hypothetical protein
MVDETVTVRKLNKGLVLVGHGCWLTYNPRQICNEIVSDVFACCLIDGSHLPNGFGEADVRRDSYGRFYAGIT